MSRLWRVAASVAIGANWLMLASVASAAEPNLGDLCSVMPTISYVVEPAPYVGDPGGCQALAPGVEGSRVTIGIFIEGPYPDPVGSLQSERERTWSNEPPPQAASYGDEAYEGVYVAGKNLAIVFRRGAYLVLINGDALDVAAIEGYAAEIDQRLTLAGAGSGPALTASPTAFGVGIGCGVREDVGLRILACTASPFGQVGNAALVYEWRLDGVARPETGSTMQVDIVRENLPAGNHVIGVTVTDTANNMQATNSAGVDTTTAAFAVSVACTYSESQGTYDLACIAAAANAPPNALISYAWTVNGSSVGTTGDTMTRSVGQGPVQVTVFARDSVSGQQTNTASYFVTINPAGTLTNLLTLGQTSDPQNVIEALAGTAAVALVVGAGAAISGALAGAAGGLVGGGSAPVGGGSAPVGGGSTPVGSGSASPPVPGGMPLNAQPMGSETPASGAPVDPFTQLVEGQELVRELFTPTAGASPSAAPPTSNVTPSAGATTPTTGAQPSTPATTGTTSSGPTTDQVAEGAAQFLSAEAGKVPPLTPENLEQWRNLSGFPNTPEGTAALQRHLNELRQLQQTGKNPDTDLFLKMLREQAVEIKPPTMPPTPSAPNPDKAFEDAANLLDRTDLEWQHDIDRTKLPQPPPDKPGKTPEK
jgi:hypothetical protein